MTPQKRCRIEFRISPSERDRLLALATEAGMNVSDYLRHIAINGKVPPVTTDVAIRTYWELGKVGTSLTYAIRLMQQNAERGQPVIMPPQLVQDLQSVLQQIRIEIAGIKRTNEDHACQNH
jgi:hypothetical protein